MSTGAVTPDLVLRNEPRQARGRERVERILEVAKDLVAREGVDALTTTRVADEVGISVGSLYHYFTDKAAIVNALARAYLDEFEGEMERLAAESEDGGWDDPVATILDAFAERYRREPAYRALWFGRALSAELLEADRRNKAALAEGLRRLLADRGLARDGDALATACFAGVLAADALLQEAFRRDPRGEPALLDEAKVMLRGYLGVVTQRTKGDG